MDFTDPFSQTLGVVHFSPGRYFILSAVKDRLVVRRSDQEGVAQTWQVDCSPSATTAALFKGTAKPPPSDGWITHAAWSPDSEYILAVVAKRGVVNVFSMRDEKWTARIEAGVEGLTRAEWAPDSRSIICFSEWGLRVTVWSLSSATATYIQFPKYPDKGYAFRKDGRYFVLAERHKSKDMLGVYDCPSGYKLVRHFALPTTSLASIALSPTGNHVAVWEAASEFKVAIVNLVGQHLATFTPNEETLLGVRQVIWHPSGEYLIIGGWDSKVYILSNLEWRLVATIQLTAKLPIGTVQWREPLNWLSNTRNRGFLPFTKTVASNSTPLVISISKPPAIAPTILVANASPNPKSGVTSMEFSASGTLLLATWEQCPTLAFIYHFPPPEEPFIPQLRTIIQCTQPISQAKMSYEPTISGTTVALCTGTGAVYLWNDDRELNEDGERGELTECVAIPTEKKFACKDVRWSPDGKGLLLMDKDAFCAAFEVENEQETY
ncbi:hypothetical protein FRB91_007404 [Serendipita sp. 411]|nr:hypothetical protein FRC19_008150 [Serendipita sp. 401]KAG8851729.1 hypothetical protein FRB91_007404 [Serendipita sp. 411]KAG9057111.1 hypothetical protein FS842_008594 [Serendipita sp. 407]